MPFTYSSSDPWSDAGTCQGWLSNSIKDGELRSVLAQAFFALSLILGTGGLTGAGRIPAFHSVLCARVFAVDLETGYPDGWWEAQSGRIHGLRFEPRSIDRDIWSALRWALTAPAFTCCLEREAKRDVSADPDELGREWKVTKAKGQTSTSSHSSRN